MQPVTISIEKAAESIGVSRGTIYNLIARGQLETAKVGRRRLIKTDSVRALVDVA